MKPDPPKKAYFFNTYILLIQIVMLLLFFKKDGAYLFIITKALESKPIYFKPPPYCNPTHAPTPLGSKPIRFRFQVLWVRMQSISFPKPAGIEANRLIPLGPNAIQFIIQSRWARMQSISFSKSAGIEPNRLVPLGPNTSQFHVPNPLESKPI